MPIQPENAARYPPDWERRSFFVRFVRGKGHCEWCGAIHGKPHPITGSIVVLTTAHVFDQAPEAASLLNLAGLCQRCHLGHDRAHHAEMAIRNRDRRRGQATLDFGVKVPQIPHEAPNGSPTFAPGGPISPGLVRSTP